MPKTAAQKARRKAARQKRGAKRRALGVPANNRRRAMRPITLVENIRQTKKSRRRAVRRAGGKRAIGPRMGPMNAAYRRARFGNAVGDGISIMKTVHNSSVIEDTFAVRREKVANIIGTTSTNLNVNLALYLNPGNSVLFPIFSQIAATYEQFRVNELIFSYETEAYAASGTNVSAGKVILATNYDPSDVQFSSDTQMENYFNSDRGAPFAEIVHDAMGGDHALRDEPVKCYFVNSAANTIAPTSDSTNNKFYDVGLFQLATQGNASATAEIGELYVTYSFTMIRPKQQTPAGQNLPSSHYNGAVQTTANAFVGSTKVAGSNINMTVASNVITFATLGRYNVLLVNVDTTTTTSGAPTLGAGVTYVVQTNYATYGVSGDASNRFAMYFVVDVISGTAATITMNNTVVAGLTWDLYVSQIPGSLALVKSEEDEVLASRIEKLEGKLARFASFFESHPLDLMDSDEKSPEFVTVRRTPTIKTMRM